MLAVKKIKKNIIISILLISILPLIFIATAFYIQSQKSLTKLYQIDLSFSDKAANDYFSEQSENVLLLARIMANDPRVVSALIDKDRTKLMAVLAPFCTMHDADISLLEVGDKNGIVFLRAHNFEKYGDNKNNDVGIIKALAKEETSGFAVGNSGLMLRGFVPILFNGEVVGTLQLGRDFTPSFFDKMDNFIDGECAIYYNGAIVRYSKENRRSSADDNDTDGDYLGKELSAGINNKIMRGEVYEEAKNADEIALYVPIYDIGDKNVIGTLRIDKDISYLTNTNDSIYKVLFVLIFCMALVGMVVAIFIGRYITRAEEEVDKVHGELEDKVLERTAELLSKNDELFATNKALEEAQMQLVQTEKMRALGSLVAGVAHEINTPVGVSVTATSHLQKTVKDCYKLFAEGKLKKQDMVEFLQDCEEASTVLLTNLERAGKLIQSFKQVSVDQTNEEKRRINVKQYIEETLLSLKPELKKTEHQVSVYCADDLTMECEPGAFAQILTNFIMNSLIHAFDDVEKGKISIEVEGKADGISFCYKDNGKGMSEDIRSKVFDPFFTTRRGDGGTGLGMHMVYNIVTQKFGGTIDCQSETGAGVCFTMFFPQDIQM